MRYFLVFLLALAACSSGGGESATLPENLSVAPHIRHLEANSAVIAWVTAEPGVGEIECVGEYGPHALLAGTEPTREHSFRIDGLQPDTVYTYGVGAETHEFRTPKGSGPIRFAVLGDAGQGGEPQAHVAAALGRAAPDLVFTTGDNAYEEGRWDEVVERYFTPYAELMTCVPFYPCLGNHDVATADGAPLLTLTGLERYYAVRRDNALIICLDSTIDMGPGSPQHEWLLAELATSLADWTVLYFHHPPYSSSLKHGSDLRVRAALASVFAQHKIDLVFNGHDHVYERTVAIDGTVYVVTGGGGNRLYEAGESWFTAHSESIYHFVFVTIDGLRLSLEARDAEDRVFDSLVITKTR